MDGYINHRWQTTDFDGEKMECEEGNVIVSWDGGFTHHKVLVPGRFVVLDPYQVGRFGLYNETHFSPGEEGAHVMKLTSRDALSLEQSLAGFKYRSTVDLGGA